MVGGVKSSVILETQALFLFLLPYYWSDGFALLMTTKGCSSRHHLTLQHPGVGGIFPEGRFLILSQLTLNNRLVSELVAGEGKWSGPTHASLRIAGHTVVRSYPHQF